MVGRPEKYVALTAHLQKTAKEFRDSGEENLTMTFRAIEGLGINLPSSAYNHRAWWANNQGTGRADDPVDKPWQRAKFYTVDVDMKKREVTFHYWGKNYSSQGKARRAAREAARRAEGKVTFRQLLQLRRAGATSKPAGAPPVRRHQLYGALKGYIRLVAGTDLAKPTNPDAGSGKS